MSGFIVRSRNELMACTECKKCAIPTEHMFNRMKELDLIKLEEWQPHCSDKCCC